MERVTAYYGDPFPNSWRRKQLALQDEASIGPGCGFDVERARPRELTELSSASRDLPEPVVEEHRFPLRPGDENGPHLPLDVAMSPPGVEKTR